MVAPAWAAPPADPTAQVEGELLRLADEGHDAAHGGQERQAAELAIRLPDGTFVPVAGAALASVSPGATVRATVEVPPAVVAAARRGGTVVGPDGDRHEVDRTDLAETSGGRPAAADTDLGRATTARAKATGSDLETRAVAVIDASRAAYTPAVHDVTVAVVVPRGVTASPNSAAAVRAQVAAASSYWSDQTSGSVTLRVAAISAPYTSSLACGASPFSYWNEAAGRLRFTQAPNTHLVVSLPRAALEKGCTYGLGSIGAGPNSGGVVMVADTAWPVLAHEIGHNFGLGHARSLRSSRADLDLRALGNLGSVIDYGDPYDVMAASAPDRAGSLSSVQAAAVGFLAPPNLLDHATGTRTVALRPLSGYTGLRALRVTDPSTGERYFVEYRTRMGRDRLLYENMSAGVRVLKADNREAGGRASVALDATPTASAKDLTWHITPGGTFTTRSGRVSIRVGAQTATAATVTVTAGSAATARRAELTPAAPKVSAPAVSSNASTSARIGFGWSGAPAGWGYDVRFRPVVRGVAGPVRTWLSGTTRTSATLSGAIGATYQVSVRARKGAAASAWSPWRTSTIPVDATAAGVTPKPAWRAARSAGYFAGTSLSTTRPGAALTLPTAHARTISVVGARHRSGGRAHVYVDGRLATTLDSYAPTTRLRQVLATVKVPAGRHSVKIVNAAGARRGLVLDAVAYAP